MPKRKLSSKEKKRNAEIKRELIEQGVLQPDKPRLNRQKFIDEAETEWTSRSQDCLIWDVYLMSAVFYVLGHCEKAMRPSREAVGAAKVLKIAMRLREFSEELKAKGETEYNIIDQYKYIKDIMDL